MRDPDAVAALRTELEAADFPFDVVTCDGVAHAFALPFVGPSTGFAYDADAHANTSRRLQGLLVAF